MPTDFDIRALLTGLGFGDDEAYAAARQALEESKLTTSKKQRIDGAKRPRVEALLSSAFLVTCGDEGCDARADGRRLLPAASPDQCQVCGGSSNRRALEAAREQMRKARLTRLVVVGGAPSVHESLRRMKPAEWELRIVEGTARRTADQARGDLRWADLVIVWGATELDHKVSELYTVHRDPRCVTINRRGLAALFDAVTEHTRRHRQD